MLRNWSSIAIFNLTLAFVWSSMGQAADPSLRVWWKLDEGEGTVVADASGNGIEGTFSGAPVWVAGVHGMALQFDGVDDFVEHPLPAAEPFPSGTVALWAKAESLAQVQYKSPFTSHYPNTAGLQIDVDGSDPGVYRVNPPGGTTLVFGDVVLEWVHLTLVWEGTATQLYYNGVPTGSGSLTEQNTTFNQYAIGVNRNRDQWFDGLVDDLQVYERALTEAEILDVMVGDVELSSPLSPEDEAVDVPRDAVLTWEAGAYAATHDVYFGSVFEDVNDADRADPRGVLVSQEQTATTFDPARFEFGQTYYWRVDEVNSAPDHTIFKGKVWSFTAERLAYPVSVVAVTTNAVSDPGAEPEHLIDGSGLNADDQHSVESDDMWLAASGDGEPVTLEFEFDRLCKLHEMLVWNYNVAFEPLLGFGIKTAVVESSADGANWASLGEVELAQATASATYAANTAVDFGGVAARYVRLTVTSGYGTMGKYGLSEVRFLAIPVQASDPQPTAGATDIGVATSLSWRSGREAGVHEVSLGTDPNGLSLLGSVVDSTIDPGPFDLATAYYWKVDEVNEAESIARWEGAVWSFVTEEYIILDDFESYNDEDDLIYEAWIDGWVNGTGSTVGYFEAPFAEQGTVHSGSQALPLFYENASSTAVSEATLAFDTAQDWTQNNAQGLVLWFFGDPTNTGGELYVKVNGTKVVYDGEPENLMRMPWQKWYVDLDDLAGAGLGNVTELTIGIAGGQGLLFIDDIMLSPHERQLVTPTEPDPSGLVAHFAFDGDTSDSTGVHPGTPVGSPSFVAGKIGQAISLNGTGDYVELVGYQGILGADPITVVAWVKTTTTVTGAIVGWGPDVAGQRFGFRVDDGRIRHEHHGGNIQGETTMTDGLWHHVAITVQPNATVSYPEATLWLDGLDDTIPTTDPDPYDITAGNDACIGCRASVHDRLFLGQIDELYIYNRVLSQAEIAYLAGRTQPFDTE